MYRHKPNIDNIQSSKILTMFNTASKYSQYPYLTIIYQLKFSHSFFFSSNIIIRVFFLQWCSLSIARKHGRVFILGQNQVGKWLQKPFVMFESNENEQIGLFTVPEKRGYRQSFDLGNIQLRYQDQTVLGGRRIEKIITRCENLYCDSTK